MGKGNLIIKQKDSIEYNTNHGLWGPGCNPRLQEIIADEDYSLSFEKDENVPFGYKYGVGIDKQLREEKRMNNIKSELATVSSLYQSILGAIKISNINLIHMQRRFDLKSKLNTQSDRIILQSKAISLFKGNFIRLLKQYYSSQTINTIKSRISISLPLGHLTNDGSYTTVMTSNPYISSIHIKFAERDYNSCKSIEDKILSACREIDTLQLCNVGKQAIEFCNSEDKYPSPKEDIKELKDLNFNSINNVKFTV